MQTFENILLSLFLLFVGIWLANHIMLDNQLGDLFLGEDSSPFPSSQCCLCFCRTVDLSPSRLACLLWLSLFRETVPSG